MNLDTIDPLQLAAVFWMALAPLVAFFALIRPQRNFSANAVTTTAHVVDVVKLSTSNGTFLQAVLEYLDENQVKHTEASSLILAQLAKQNGLQATVARLDEVKSHLVGRSVMIRYHRQVPTRIRTQEDSPAMKMIPWIVMIGPVLFAILVFSGTLSAIHK